MSSKDRVIHLIDQILDPEHHKTINLKNYYEMFEQFMEWAHQAVQILEAEGHCKEAESWLRDIAYCDWHNGVCTDLTYGACYMEVVKEAKAAKLALEQNRDARQN